VIGDPFVTGEDHDIVTKSAEFVVVTVDGASGLKAQSNVMLSDKAL